MFRGLTHGGPLEPVRVPTDQRCLKALAISGIVAWRSHHLTMAGRADPEGAGEGVCEPQEWYPLSTMPHHGPPPPTPPSRRARVRSLAPLGGFCARQGDGEPGLKAIWQG